jgi:hypothetical protein
MKSRHGQWLIVIKNLAHIQPELTQAAATRRQPNPTGKNQPAATRVANRVLKKNPKNINHPQA